MVIQSVTAIRFSPGSGRLAMGPYHGMCGLGCGLTPVQRLLRHTYIMHIDTFTIQAHSASPCLLLSPGCCQ